MKQQFVVTNTINQIEITALLDGTQTDLLAKFCAHRILLHLIFSCKPNILIGLFRI